MTSRPEQLTRIVDLSNAMLERAKAQAWDALDVLERERQPLIEACFAQPPLASEVAATRSALEAILAADAQVRELAGEALGTFARECREVSAGKKAVAAYARHR